MLIQQVKFQFSAYSSLYNLIVPKQNLLRKINDLIDFPFVYNELVTKYCHNNGRAAESPIRMFHQRRGYFFIWQVSEFNRVLLRILQLLQVSESLVQTNILSQSRLQAE